MYNNKLAGHDTIKILLSIIREVRLCHRLDADIIAYSRF